MTRVLAIGFGPAPDMGFSSAQAALDLLAAERWRPVDATLDIVMQPWLWWPPRDPAAEAARYDAVLLIATGRVPDRALVRPLATNRADSRARDIAGYCWAGSVIAPGAGPVRTGRLPETTLARALSLGGLDGAVARDAIPSVPNRALFEVLGSQPMAALVEVPVSMESARRTGLTARFNRCEILSGVQAALTFVAAAAMATAP